MLPLEMKVLMKFDDCTLELSFIMDKEMVLDSIETKGFFIQMPPEGLIDPNAVEPEGLRGA